MLQCGCAGDLCARAPLVLQCGHAFCKSCIENDLAQHNNRYIVCSTCGKPDSRHVAHLARNFNLVDVDVLDTAAAAIMRGHNTSGRLWLNDQDLIYSTPREGSPTNRGTGELVKGLYKGEPVLLHVISLHGAPFSAVQSLVRDITISLAALSQCQHTAQYKGLTIKDKSLCLVLRGHDTNLAAVQQLAGGTPGQDDLISISNRHVPQALSLQQILQYSNHLITAICDLQRHSLCSIDLGPSKLLLDHDDDQLLVSDFGLRKLLVQHLQQPAVEAAVTSMGPHPAANYIAPEMFDGSGRITFSTDLWCWACCVAHMASGGSPFEGQSTPLVQHKLCNLRQVPEVPMSLPPFLRALLSRCWALEPNNRPTAEQVKQVMQEHLPALLTELGPSANHRLSSPAVADLLGTAVAPAPAGSEAQQQQQQQQQQQVDLVVSVDQQKKQHHHDDHWQQVSINGQHDTQQQKKADGTKLQLQSDLISIGDDQGRYQHQAKQGFMSKVLGRSSKPVLMALGGANHDDQRSKNSSATGAAGNWQQLLLAGRVELLGGTLKQKLMQEKLYRFDHPLASWDKGLDPSSWNGVLVVWNEQFQGPEVSPTPVLQALHLAPLGGFEGSAKLALQGRLPKAWHNLRTLVSLDLSGNGIGGTLPAAWSSLTALTALDLSCNRLTWRLPDEWSTLVNLRELCLYQNQLVGRLPACWSVLTNLRMLTLYSNRFNGELPVQWSGLVSLQTLVLSDNLLEGPLPATWGALPELQNLRLSGNKLSGQLPARWGALSQLGELSLSSNRLTGSLPHQWSALTALQWLHLDGNQLNGPICPEWSGLSRLKSVDIRNSQVGRGWIPRDWRGRVEEQELEVHGSHL